MNMAHGNVPMEMEGEDGDYEAYLHRVFKKYYQEPVSEEEWRNVAKGAPSYPIQRGDTLWDISRVLFGDPFYWPKLWSLNSYITNPHLIREGNKLHIRLGSAESPPLVSGPDASGVSGASAFGGASGASGASGAPGPLLLGWVRRGYRARARALGLWLWLGFICIFFCFSGTRGRGAAAAGGSLSAKGQGVFDGLYESLFEAPHGCFASKPSRLVHRHSEGGEREDPSNKDFKKKMV